MQGDVVSSLVNSVWDSLSGTLGLDKIHSSCELNKRWEAQCSGPILVYSKKSKIRMCIDIQRVQWEETTKTR